MSRYQTRQTVIEAVQVAERMVISPTETFYQNIYVVYPGDYLCIDDQGYKFPCRSDVFEKIYEPLTD